MTTAPSRDLDRRGTLIVSIARETITATGPLVASTVDVLLLAIGLLIGRGLMQIQVDLDGVDDLDFPAIKALSASQRRACSSGRELRINLQNPALRLALTGCHLEPDVA